MKQTIRQQYMKERRRIQSFIRRAQKRGYIIPESILPIIPKNITKSSINRLKKITPDKIYSKSEYINKETGELVSAKRGRIIERKKATEKAKATRQAKQKSQVYSPPKESELTIYNLMQILENFVPSGTHTPYMRQQMESNRNYALGILQNAIDELGIEKVASNIKNSERLSNLIDEILYSSDREKVKFSLVEFSTIIRGESLSIDENIALTEEQEEI